MVWKHEWFYCPHCGKAFWLSLRHVAKKRQKPFECCKCHQLIEELDKVRKVRTNIYGTPIPVDACKAPLGYECEYLNFYAEGKWKGHSKCESPDGECEKSQEDFDEFLGVNEDTILIHNQKENADNNNDYSDELDESKGVPE